MRAGRDRSIRVSIQYGIRRVRPPDSTGRVPVYRDVPELPPGIILTKMGKAGGKASKGSKASKGGELPTLSTMVVLAVIFVVSVMVMSSFQNKNLPSSSPESPNASEQHDDIVSDLGGFISWLQKSGVKMNPKIKFQRDNQGGIRAMSQSSIVTNDFLIGTPKVSLHAFIIHTINNYLDNATGPSLDSSHVVK